MQIFAEYIQRAAFAEGYGLRNILQRDMFPIIFMYVLHHYLKLSLRMGGRFG